MLLLFLDGLDMKIRFYEFNEIDESSITFAVIISQYKGKWVWVKNKMRNAWEVPGGRREGKESILKTAKRELYEETGAIKFDIAPVCIYSVKKDIETFGMLYYAKIIELGALPESEIEDIGFFDVIPDKLLFPLIQPILKNRVKDFLQMREH